jgi:D-beta-D-heptose 7-phosphate kinase/D-beta-D-heptose 1-phosphate adenosyltransferase
MQFIKNIKEEKDICNNYLIQNRNNSLKIDYLNKVNDKPWGKEYLAYQNNKIGIWILHVNKDQETSLHCHFKKDTILIPISGCFRINLFNSLKIVNIFESLYIPLNTFHGIHAYSDNAVLMEIEIYTEDISYTDKNDLLRIKDIYNRDKNNYETSIIERIPLDDEIMNFHNINNYTINNTKISILTINNLKDIKIKYNQIILLEGILFSNGKRITSGSFIYLNDDHSFLTKQISILCLSNIDDFVLKKIIYSKQHLIDFLHLHEINSNNIGLTSGCFDILHEGHIKNLKICKTKIQKLFVCLSSDEQIKRLKGNCRPINNINDRMYMLMHFDFIDFIILYDEINDDLETELDNIINIVNPNIWFKGTDYKKEDILKKHPGLKNIELINLIENKSTTNIINKILK